MSDQHAEDVAREADAAADRTAIEVEIAGERYTLRAEANEKHLRRCAAIVDARLREVAVPGARAGTAAVLAALTLADELLRQQKWTGDRIRALTELVEGELGD